MDKKTIAVILRDRQSEALRMSIGLTILEDYVEVFLTEQLKHDGETEIQLEGAKEMGVRLFSIASSDDPGFERIKIEEMAERLIKADNIIAY